MTDEELSELAECLQDACVGAPVGTLDGDWCPLGALMAEQCDGGGRHRPGGHYASKVLGIPEGVALSFIHGFEGATRQGVTYRQGLAIFVDDRAFALGRLFREEFAR